MTAKADELQQLHALLAKTLANEITSGEGPPQASLLNVARQFLKDNNVTSSVKHDPNLGILSQEVPFSEPDEYGLVN